MNEKNKVRLLGTLEDDPEVTVFDDGQTLVVFYLTTTEAVNSKDGMVKQTVRSKVLAWDEQAEISMGFLKKHNRVFVVGHLIRDKFNLSAEQESDLNSENDFDYHREIQAEHLSFVTSQDSNL